LRKIDAEFIRHTLQEVVLRLHEKNGTDNYIMAKVNKASKLLEAEEKARRLGLVDPKVVQVRR
jgi:peptidyl-tRNA hydrolase